MKKQELFTKYKFIDYEIKIIQKIYNLEYDQIESFFDAKNETERALLFQGIRMAIEKEMKNA